MKKKIVVKVSMNNDKCRSKALQIAVCIPGVESAALTGAEKDQVVVVGEAIDPVALTRQLRKSVGYTELVSVGDNKKEESAAAKVEAPPPQSVVWSYPLPYNGYPVYEVRPSSDPNCIIM